MAAPIENETISKLINTRDFLTKLVRLLGEEQCRNKEDTFSDESLVNQLNIDNETFEELSAVCSVDTVKISDEPPKDIYSGNVPAESELLSSRLMSEELQRRQDIQYKKTSLMKKLKYKPHRLHPYQVKSESIPPEYHIQYPEIVLSVKVYAPYLKKSKQPAMVNEEFLVLGKQHLTELRDRISCVADYSVAGNFAENPDQPQDVRAKDLYKSGFFYIEGTFYNDMRDANCRDYSKVIIDWAKDGKKGIGPFITRKMEEMTFLDLNLCLGQPYVYIHQGDCEHIIVFSDISLIDNDDPQDVRLYPLCVSKHLQKRIPCCVCQTLTAKWQVYKCQLLVENPSFFCDQCYHALLYDKENSKVTNFEAYPYIDTTAIIS